MRDRKIKHGFVNYSGSKQAKDTKIKPITESEIVNSIYYLLRCNDYTVYELEFLTKVSADEVGDILIYLRKNKLLKVACFRKCNVKRIDTYSYTAEAIEPTDAITKSSTKKPKVRDQARKTFKAFSERPKTMKAVAVEIGIERTNICQYVSEFRESDTIEFLYRGLCPITGNRANFYLTKYNL